MAIRRRAPASRPGADCAAHDGFAMWIGCWHPDRARRTSLLFADGLRSCRNVSIRGGSHPGRASGRTSHRCRWRLV